jgi:hypothetical protein
MKVRGLGAIGLLTWTLLIQSNWAKTDEPTTPDSQWDVFGEFDEQKTCESYRTQLVAEQRGPDLEALKIHSVCKPQ